MQKASFCGFGVTVILGVVISNLSTHSVHCAVREMVVVTWKRGQGQYHHFAIKDHVGSSGEVQFG